MISILAEFAVVFLVYWIGRALIENRFWAGWFSALICIAILRALDLYSVHP
jgi:4-amino-4-deoxy-L-arabinose transferase-like glycosyltransferase